MPDEKQAVLQRLRTVRGHLDAVCRMIEEDYPNQEILHQLNAVRCAVDAAGGLLLRLEVENCLQAIRDYPLPGQDCEEIVRLASLYPLVTEFTRNNFEQSSR